MPDKWVDFKAIKEGVTMQMVLDHYEVAGLKQIGVELRGPCPIHKGLNHIKQFSVNPGKNAFRCFFCKAHGNVLDFVAAMEQCTVLDAARKLRDWFKVGDSDKSKNEAIESLMTLVGELEVHHSQIAYHASLAEAKMTAVKEIVASLQKED